MTWPRPVNLFSHLETAQRLEKEASSTDLGHPVVSLMAARRYYLASRYTLELYCIIPQSIVFVTLSIYLSIPLIYSLKCETHAATLQGFNYTNLTRNNTMP